MTISFVPAHEEDAAVIAALRQRVWRETYRGIYPDEWIDAFDFAAHESRNLSCIRDASFRVFLIKDGATAVGYLFFQHCGAVRLRSLYLIRPYQRRGIGSAAFTRLRAYCRQQSVTAFTCFCHPQNGSALAFYKRMGGVVVGTDTGHENRYEDQLTLRFSV